MAQSKPRSALALTHSLDKAKARYPWAKAWVQVRGGFWCFESEAEARGSEAGFHEPFRWARIRKVEAEAVTLVQVVGFLFLTLLVTDALTLQR